MKARWRLCTGRWCFWYVSLLSLCDVIYDICHSYYDELVSLESKLSGSSPQIAFKWKDAFDKGSLFTGRASLSKYH